MIRCWTSVTVAIVLSVLICFPTFSSSLEFRIQLPKLTRRCYYQDVLKNTLMVISAEVHEEDQIDFKVSHSDTLIFQEKNKQVMRTAFTSTMSGDYSICVANFGAKSSTVKLKIEQGSEAKDYTQIAKKEHLDPLILSLRKVEDQLKEYHKNLLHMRSKELKMRKINDGTASQIILFSMLTVGVMFAATLLQILYFRHFLRSKKII